MSARRTWIAKWTYGIRASLGLLKESAGEGFPAGTVYFMLTLDESAGRHAGRAVYFRCLPEDLDTLRSVVDRAIGIRDGAPRFMECDNCGNSQEVQ